MTLFYRCASFLLLTVMSFSFYYQNDAIIIFDGKRMDFRSTPIIQENNLNVPLKEIAGILNISYLKNNSIITLDDGNKTLTYHKNNDKVIVNKNTYYMPQSMFYYETDDYVPLSFFSWYLGYSMHRKGQIYYVSKILGKAIINEESIQLIFSCRIDDKDFKLVKEKSGEYTLDLNHTILNFPRINQSNQTFGMFFLSQMTTNPSRSKAIIKSNKDLEIVKTINSLIIKPKELISPIISVEVITSEKPTVNVETISNERSTDKATWIPSFENVSDIKLSVKGSKKTLTGKAKHDNATYLVPLDDVLLPFGYDHFIDENQNISIKYGDKQEIQTNIKAQKIGNIAYGPLQKLAKKLGLGIRWDYRIHTLFVNPIIYSAAFEKGKLGDSIVIKSYNEIEPKNIFELSNPPRLVLDIPNAVLDVNKQIIPISDSNFKQIRIAQLDEETVRVVVDLHQSRSYGLSISDDGTTATIHGAGSIQKVGYWQGNARDSITIFTNNLSKYKWERQNDKLIIDFENMNYSAKQSYSFTKTADIHKIVGTQHSWDPLTARMTFYIDNNLTFNLERNKNNLILLINKKTITKTKPQQIKETKPVQKSSSPLNGKVIVVESGHGGIDVGAVGYGNHYEKWFNLDISHRIQKQLIDAGATVLMPLNTDTYMSLSSRTMYANRNNADFYLSVHLNSFVKSYANGIETYYFKYMDKDPAKYIQQALVKHLNRYDKGIKQNRLFVLYHTKMPAVLIEPVFISNPTEYNLLLNPQFRDKIATAVVEGITNYYAH